MLTPSAYTNELFSLSSVFANCASLLLERVMPCEWPWWPPCSKQKQTIQNINLKKKKNIFEIISFAYHKAKPIQLYWLEVQSNQRTIIVPACEFFPLQRIWNEKNKKNRCNIRWNRKLCAYIQKRGECKNNGIVKWHARNEIQHSQMWHIA